jgi:hypothetical protein
VKNWFQSLFFLKCKLYRYSAAVGRALAFIKGIVSAAAAPDGDQALRETAGAEILPACLGGAVQVQSTLPIACERPVSTLESIK